MNKQQIEEFLFVNREIKQLTWNECAKIFHKEFKILSSLGKPFTGSGLQSWQAKITGKKQWGTKREDVQEEKPQVPKPKSEPTVLDDITAVINTSLSTPLKTKIISFIVKGIG